MTQVRGPGVLIRAKSFSEAEQIFLKRLFRSSSQSFVHSPPRFQLPIASDFESDEGTTEPDDRDRGRAAAQTERVTAQMLLVCCWRSMKEVSLLLGQLALAAPLCSGADCSGLVTQRQVRQRLAW